MSSYRYEPSRPAAVLGIVFGVGLLVFGLALFGDAEGGQGFLVFWCIAVVAITGLNTWAAFSRRGSLGTYTRVDDESSHH